MKLLSTLLFFSLIFSHNLFSQKGIDVDSIHSHKNDSINMQFISLDFMNPSNDNSRIFGDNLSFFFYDYSDISLLSLFNGTNGSFSKSLIFTPNDRTDIHDITANFNSIFLHKENIIITDLPVSNAFYSQGKNREQIFKFSHFQTINKKLTFGLNYNILNIPGLYSNQKTNFSGLNTYLFYLSPNKKYSTLFNFISNTISINENGGIMDLSEFENAIQKDRQFVKVNITSAENRIRKRNFIFNQTAKFNIFKAPLYCSLHSEISGYNRVYNDKNPDSSYYCSIFLQTNYTLDSMKVSKVYNCFYISNYIPHIQDTLKLHVYAGIDSDFSHLKLFAINEKSYAFNFFGFAKYSFNNASKISARTSYDIGNFKNNVINFNLQFERNNIQKFINYYLIKINFIEQEPESFYKNYYSNHFIWNNILQKERILSLSSHLKTDYFSFGFKLYNIQNYVFFSSIIIPYQYNNNLQVGVGYIEAEKEIGRVSIYINSGIQKVSDIEMLRLPLMYSLLRGGYNFTLFHGALNMYAGMQTLIFSKFKSDTWSPVLMQYYIQNNYEIGNYLYPSVFLSCRIKRARIFGMVENITAGLFKNNYYAMPGYPRNDRFLRWGISWNFIN